ncbi:MAG: hypothetical protein E7478_07195 [Ruminococcaceae bacterium]|nr:hypothetical protein [Oscillospiraceae bacterium]
MQDETGEEIPSEEEYPDFMLEFTAAIALSQTDGITVVVSGSAAITAETLKEALHYKADKDHSHDIADVDGLQTALNGKSNSSHSHAISDVMGLQTVLDGKANISGKPVVTSIVPMDGAVKLSWLPVEGATQYAVSLYNTSTGKYTVLNKTLTATDYTATGLTNGTEYQFLVQACLNDTWSKYAVSDHVYAIPEKINAPASATAEGYVTTGSQTFAGTKTFKGSILCGGSHNLDVAQARAIYAGTTDMIAGETYLPTGAIYLVYE